MVATREQKEVMVIAQAIIYEFSQLYPEAIGRLFAVLALPPNRQTKNQLHQCIGAYRQRDTSSFPPMPPISDSSAPI